MIEKVISQINDRLTDRSSKRTSQTPPTTGDPFHSITPALETEIQFLEELWINSCKQLGDWSLLENFSNNGDVSDETLLMDSAWSVIIIMRIEYLYVDSQEI